MKKERRISMLAGLLALLMLWSCEKPPGPGGKATIKGRVYARDWDNTQRYEVSKGYSAGERVYICYGSSNIPGNDTRTGIDGTFEFRYLNKGHYKIFVNSLDTTVILKGNDTEIPVVKEVDITGDRQTADVGDIRINK
jgi:hypothetical protein